MRVLAIMPAYNEADIIRWSVRHLRGQGVDVLVLDTGSTDDTAERARKAGAEVRDISKLAVNGRISWREVLVQVEDAALFNRLYDWCMLNDADEFRVAGYNRGQEPTLNEALGMIDAQGYDAAWFQVFTFHPIDNGYDGSQDPQQYFRYYERDRFNERIGQQKAWKNDRPVELAWSGGHQITLAGRRPKIYSAPMISKHYPIRSQQHGERKVFNERRPRWSDPEKDWHIQYKDIEPGYSFLKDPATLKEWR